MADVNANINVDINTSSALANLRKLQGQITAFNESVISSNAAAAASQRQLNSSLVQQVSAIKGFSTSIGNVETSMSRLGSAIEKNKLSLGEYFKYGVASSQTFGRVFSKEHNQVMDLATDRVKRLQTQYVALGESQHGLTKALAARPLNLFNADAQIATQRSQIFNKLLRDGSTSLVNFGKNTQWAGRQLMVGFTLPITMFGTVAAKVFSDLEKQIINFKRVYGDLGTTVGETEMMVDQIKVLGKEYTKYGIAVSDTIGLAAKAAAMGAQGADLMAATEEATRLATLGQIEQNQALDATISLQTAFKISTDELASSIDFLNAVENQTVTSLDDITVAIPKVAPVIKGLGGDVKDLALFMTAMREGGVNAAEGANALKSGLASLINPTKAAREQLAAVGINIDTILSKNKGDLRGLVTEFGNALGTVNKFERQQTLAKVFGKYQFARMGALFENINRDGSQASRVLDLAGASMEDLAKLSEKELGNIEQAVSVKFTAAVEKLKLAIAPIGEMFLKIATPIVNVLTVVADKFAQLPDVIKTVIAYGLGIGAVLVPSIIMLVGLLGNFLGNIMKIGVGFRSLMARITGNADAFQWLSNSELDAMAATASLEGATSSLTGVLAIQKETVDALALAYTRMADSAQIAASNMPQAMRGPIVGGRTPRRMATGGFVAGKGNKDTEPALLTPGEFVVNKKAAQQNAGVLSAMNSGKISKYAKGTPSNRSMSYSGSSFELSLTDTQFRDMEKMLARLETWGVSTEDVLQSITNNFVDSQKSATVAMQDFKKGFSGKASFAAGEKELAHLRPQDQPSAENIAKILAKGGLSDSGRQTLQIYKAVNEVVPGAIKVAEKSNLVYSIDKLVNQKLASPSGIGAGQLSESFKTAGVSGFGALIEQGSALGLSQEMLTDQAKTLTNEMQRLLDIEAKNGTIIKDVVTARERELGGVKTFGEVFDQATSNVKENIRELSTTIDRVDSDFSQMRATVRVLTEKELRDLAAAGVQVQQGGKGKATTFTEGDTTASVYQNTSKSKMIRQSILDYGIAGRKAAVSFGQGFVSAAPDVVREAMGKFRNSPHPSAFPAGEMDGNAYAEGFRLTASQARGAVLLDANGTPMPTTSAPQASTAQQGEAGNSINQVSQEANRTSRGFRKLGSVLKSGGLKMQGAFFAVDGLVLGMSMMNNAVGEFAQKIMPAAFAVQGLATMLPLLTNPLGLLVAGIGGLVALMIYGRSKWQEMIDKAYQKGMLAADSMQAVADAGAAFGKKMRTLNVEKLGFKSQQKTATQQFFETEQGQAQISGLQTNRQDLGREGFNQKFARETALSAITQGWTGKQIDAYVSTVAEKLGDKKMYVDVRGQLASLLDPENKQDILKNGLLIKVNAEAGQNFLKNQMKVSQASLDQFRVASTTASATPSGMIQKNVNDVDELAKALQKAKDNYNGLLSAGKDANGKLIEDTDRLYELEQQYLLAQSEAQGAYDRAAMGITNVVNAKYDEAQATREGAAAGAIFGEHIMIGNQYLAQQKTLLDGGKVTQKQYNKNVKEANTLLQDNARAMKSQATELGNFGKGDGSAYAAYMKSISDQIFANLDKDLQGKVAEALNNVTDSGASIDLQVAYAQGSISIQDLMDLTTVIDKIPPEARTDIIVGYGNGSLTNEELTYLNNNMDQLVGFDKSQINVLIGVSGLENVIEAMRIIQEINKLGKVTDENFMEYSYLQGQLSRIPKDTPTTEGKTPGGETPPGEKPPGEKGSGKANPIKDYLSNLMTEIKQYQDVNAKFKSLGNIFSKFQGLANNLRGKLPEGLIAELVSKGDDGLKIANAMIDKRTGKLTKLGQKIKKMYEGSEIGKVFSDLQAETTAAQQKAQVAQSFKLPGNAFTKEQQEVILGNDALVRQFATVKSGTPAYKKLTDQVIALAAAQKLLADATDEATQLDQLEKAWSDYSNAVNAAFDAEKIKTEDALASAFLAKNKMTVEKMKEQITANEELIQKQQDLIDGKQKEIDAYQHTNDLTQQHIDDMNREVDMRNRISDAIGHDLDLMSQAENEIRSGYDERIKALDEISSINQNLIDQQKTQLGLSQALSQGDIYAAAAAAQQMQQSQAQYAADQVRAGLQKGMETEIANLRTSEGLTREQAEEKIAAIKEQNYQTSLAIRTEEDKIYNNNLLIRGLNNDIYNLQNGIMKTYQDQNKEYEKLLNNYQKELDYATSHLVAAGMTADQWERANKEHTTLVGSIAGNIEMVNKYKAAWDDAAKSAREAGAASSTAASAPAATASSGKAFKSMSGTEIKDLTGSDVGAYLKWSGGGMGLAFATGGLVPRKFARGGSVGMDSIPAMLTPGEFVMRKSAVDQYGKPLLSSMNMGAISSPRYNMGKGQVGKIKGSGSSANINAPVYNTYSINVPVNQPGASADEIANVVITKIRSIDSSSVRRINGY